MTELLDHARDHIERMVATLSGDDDFMPFMVLNGAKDHLYVGLPMPDEGRDTIADVMVAILTVYRATEAVFASMAWSVMAHKREEIKVAPSQHPDRQEIAFLVHVGPGADACYTAPVIREAGKVGLGLWSGEADEDGALENIGGRFGDAMHMGIRMGSDLPIEMCAFIDEALERDDLDAVIAPFLRAMNHVRSGELTDEEIELGRQMAEDIRQRREQQQ